MIIPSSLCLQTVWTTKYFLKLNNNLFDQLIRFIFQSCTSGTNNVTSSTFVEHWYLLPRAFKSPTWMVLASESITEATPFPSEVQLLMKRGWGQATGLKLMLCVPFNALTLISWWQEGHLTCKRPIPLIPRGSVLLQVEEEDPNGNRLTQVHLEKWPWNGISSSSSLSMENELGPTAEPLTVLPYMVFKADKMPLILVQ